MHDFTLQWRDHEIKGEESYLGPWDRITKFAVDISKKLLARFPQTEFLESLDILNPKIWKTARDPMYQKSGSTLRMCANFIDERLTQQFLKCCTTLESTFTDLLPSNTIKNEFQDFLFQKLPAVRNMNDKNFTAFIINDDTSPSYTNFARYVCTCFVV
jgi:hypothetical protein